MSSVAMRQEVERKIVRRLVKEIIKAGYRVAVSTDRGYDIDEMLLGSTDVKKIMEEAFAADECHIFIQPKEGPTRQDDSVISRGWIYCVMGNDGYDVICDYTANDLTEAIMVPVNEVIDRYS